MKRNFLSIPTTLLLALLLAACSRGIEAPAKVDSQTAVSETQPAKEVLTTANLTDSCVEAYDKNVDYFPDKVAIEEASGLVIEYHNHYKVIYVTNPWRDAGITFQYVLVQCGTPAPEGFDNALIIEVPVNSVVAMSTTQLPHLDELNEVDSLVGVESFLYASNEAVRQKIDAGEVAEIGSGAEVNVEVTLDLEPDLVMTFGYGSPDYDSYPVLLEAGIPTVLNAGYMENSPLGRSEWLKFTAVFFNKEAQAQEIFAVQQKRYYELATLTATMKERPTVFANAPSNEMWRMPGGDNYLAQLLADAGANYLWSDDDSSGTMPLNFEAVFERAQNADFWINPGSWQTLAEGFAEDERFAEFAAFQNGNVFNNNARLNKNGGNPYWELGVAHPELILADLITIFHPELLPDHERIFYHNLK